MAGTILRVGEIQVFIGSEDHPPPHVHVWHQGEGWGARFRFSFLSDVVALYRFRRSGRRPTVATLEDLAGQIERSLPLCRAEWWNTHGGRHGIGLVNRQAETRTIANDDGFLVKVGLKPGKTAVGITSAAYHSITGKVLLTLADGRRLLLTAGQHIEEAKEWA
jgi:hypothetical protein